jgi:hypothetical protein
MPESRKVHVKRVFRQNDDGSNDEDVWIDVARFDRVRFNFQATLEGKLGQLINYRFNWKDDRNLDEHISGDADNENNNPNRKTEQLKVKNPDDPNDDTQTVELWIVDQAKIRLDGDEFGLNGQIVKHVFKNIPPGKDGAALARKTTVIKVVNNDLGGLDMSQSNVDWNDYKTALQNGTKDDSQHLDAEVVDRFNVNFQTGNQHGGQTGVLGQTVKYAFKNDVIEQLFDPGNRDAVDTNGDPAVLRTDPLQYIVNVGWGGLAVEFFDGDK